MVRRLDVTDKADYERAIVEFGAFTGGKMDILYNKRRNRSRRLLR